MTPNNILNMCMLKNLDFISVTDHNTAKQLPILTQIAEAYDLIVVPGIEVTVLEGFDVLCYFKTIQKISILEQYLDDYRVNDWGPYSIKDQIITDIYDEPSKFYDTPLRKTTLSYQKLYNKTKELGGIIVLAHIDRPSKTALNSYTLDSIQFDGIEIHPYNKNTFIEEHPHLTNYKQLYNSDSHTLLTIHEKTYSLPLREHSIDALFNYFLGETNE